MTVNLSGVSSAVKAYTSVSSPVGSSELNGASRWLEPLLSAVTAPPAAAAAATDASTAVVLRRRISTSSCGWGWACFSRACATRAAPDQRPGANRLQLARHARDHAADVAQAG